MAGWRRAVELTMTDEEIERLTVLFLQVRPLDPAPHPGEIKTPHHGRYRRRQPPSRHSHLVLQARRGAANSREPNELHFGSEWCHVPS